jgi:hypothetical protein
MEANNTRSLVLGETQWMPFLRDLASDAGIWDAHVTVRTREWMAPGSTIKLEAGDYALMVNWDGRGRADPSWLPTNSIVAGQELRFSVQVATNDGQRAAHLRRVAFQEWDSNQDQLARQHGLEAISLDAQNQSRDAIETYFVVASANLRLTNYLSAAQTILGMRSQFPRLSGTETDFHSQNYLKAIVPELRLGNGASSEGRLRLNILGHPGQLYELQTSTDMEQWTAPQTFTSTNNQLDVTPPDSGSSRRYYRIHWLAQP